MKSLIMAALASATLVFILGYGVYLDPSWVLTITETTRLGAIKLWAAGTAGLFTWFSLKNILED